MSLHATPLPSDGPAGHPVATSGTGFNYGSDPFYIPKATASLKPEARKIIESLAAVRPHSTMEPGSAGYEAAREKYWGREQRDTTPYCIFQADNADDVSIAVKVLREAGCPFAVRSGGHGKFAFESSISDGVLIDLHRINHVDLSEDQQSARIGPSNSWHNVYSVLQPQDLTVVGGRAMTVGVGGFILGGGISFYCNKYGWATDNVQEFEVVLANGELVTTTPSSHPDLYKALRGGGGNFGIVTSFTLDVYPYEGMWGGAKAWDLSHTDAIIDALFSYGHDNVNNSECSLLIALVHHDSQWIWHASIENLKPEKPGPESALDAILNIPAVYDTTSVTDQISEIRNMADTFPTGMHNCFWVFCVKVDRRIVKFYMDTWREEADKVMDVDGFDQFACADVQFITQNAVDKMNRRGGNTLGLAKKGPFLMSLIQPWWRDGSQSKRVLNAIRTTVDKVKVEAKRLGVWHEYVYSNYASQYQEVYSSYGAEASEFLRDTAAKYDPDRVFQDLRGAGFKLDGPIAQWQD